MTDRFPDCLAETLRWEGGWSNHPKDPGGPTMRGVIQRVYNGWRDGQQLPRRSVRLIEWNELEAIYRRNYWAMIRGDELPAGIDLAVFDFCVNSGPDQAVRSLQRALGAKIDGHLGPATMASIHAAEPEVLISAYLDERRRFYKALRMFPVFGDGWLRRAAGIEACALKMAEPSSVVMVSADAVPIPDADAQSESQAKAPTEAPKPPWVTEIVTSITGTAAKVAGLSAAFGKWSAKPAATPAEVTLFFLAEPLVLAGLVMVFAALTTFLWRRRVRDAA